MTEPESDPGRRVRQRAVLATIAERLSAYHGSLVKSLEADAEDFFNRVMTLDAERRSAASTASNHAQPVQLPGARLR